jgi:hypothetical protein
MKMFEFDVDEQATNHPKLPGIVYKHKFPYAKPNPLLYPPFLNSLLFAKLP